MENMQNFIGWIIIIFGVLQIILLATREFISDIYKIYSNVLKSENEEYVKRFNVIEQEYRAKFDNISSFIDFEKFSTYDKAQKIFC